MAKNQSKIQVNVEEYKSLFGTLFYEFNTDENLATSYFYTYFFLRRLLYGIVLFILIDNPIIQVSICVTLSLAVINYLEFILSFNS